MLALHKIHHFKLKLVFFPSAIIIFLSIKLYLESQKAINPLETAEFGKLLDIFTASMGMLKMILLFEKIHLFHALLLFS